VTTWEYRWLKTYWVESGRSDDYITTISYSQVWKPDGQTEEPFHGRDGLNRLGTAGWELVSMATSTESQPTRVSPQQGTSYSSFPVYDLVLKRPTGTV
jgi:hypothetical protein